METKLEGIGNYLQFADSTLDAAKQNERTDHQSSKRQPI